MKRNTDIDLFPSKESSPAGIPYLLEPRLNAEDKTDDAVLVLQATVKKSFQVTLLIKKVRRHIGPLLLDGKRDSNVQALLLLFYDKSRQWPESACPPRAKGIRTKIVLEGNDQRFS